MSSYTNFKVDLENKNSSWTKVYEFIDNKATILDIGCSSGYFDEVLIKQKQCTVDGIELDPLDAQKARKICRTVLVGNIEDDKFDLNELPSKQYDYIMFIDVLEHLINPSAALKRAAQLLKPKGKIIFSIPNMGNNSVRLQLLQGNFDYEPSGLLDETHLHYYTDSAIDKMISKSNLYLQDVTCTQNDVDEKMITKILKKVGLTNTKDFTEYLNKGNAVAYQYIGTIGLTPSKKTISHFSDASIKPMLFNQKVMEDVQKDARGLFKRLQTTERVLEEKELEIHELGRQIANYKKQESVSLEHKIKRAVQRIKRNLS